MFVPMRYSSRPSSFGQWYVADCYNKPGINPVSMLMTASQMCTPGARDTMYTLSTLTTIWRGSVSIYPVIITLPHWYTELVQDVDSQLSSSQPWLGVLVKTGSKTSFEIWSTNISPPSIIKSCLHDIFHGVMALIQPPGSHLLPELSPIATMVRLPLLLLSTFGWWADGFVGREVERESTRWAGGGRDTASTPRHAHACASGYSWLNILGQLSQPVTWVENWSIFPLNTSFIYCHCRWSLPYGVMQTKRSLVDMLSTVTALTCTPR